MDQCIKDILIRWGLFVCVCVCLGWCVCEIEKELAMAVYWVYEAKLPFCRNKIK